MLLMPPLIADSAAFLLLLLPLIAVSAPFFSLLLPLYCDSAAFLFHMLLHFLWISVEIWYTFLLRKHYAASAASGCRFRSLFLLLHPLSVSQFRCLFLHIPFHFLCILLFMLFSRCLCPFVLQLPSPFVPAAVHFLRA